MTLLGSSFSIMAIGFLWTAFFVPIVKRAAIHFSVVDTPDHRKVHRGSIPRWGGVAVYFGIFLTLATIYEIFPAIHEPFLIQPSRIAWIMGCATILWGVGVVDDVSSLKARQKLAFQILAGLLVFYGGFQFHFLEESGADHPAGIVVNLVATVFWVVAVTNAINLIDGLDGLASGITVISALTLGVISYTNGHPMATFLSLVIAGSAAGFLRYNVHPARIFLGDSGSLLLGFLLAVLSISATSEATPFFSMVIVWSLLSIPLLDVGLAVLRRLLKGLSLSHADGDHIHHRLLQLGLGHFSAVMILWVVTVVFGLVGMFLSISVPRQEAGFVVLLPAVLIGIVMRRLGSKEIFHIINTLRHGNRRKLSPRRKNIAVRKVVKKLNKICDLRVVIRDLITLANDLELDLMHIEATLCQGGELKKVELVHWDRPSKQRQVPPDIPGEAPKTDISLSKIAEGLKVRAGITCSVILGREAWKLRRKGEDQFWATLLADGISLWIVEKGAFLHDDSFRTLIRESLQDLPASQDHKYKK